MKITTIFFILISQIFFVIGCADKNKLVEKDISAEDRSFLYNTAMVDLNSEDFINARIKFQDMIFKFPLSNEGIQSKIMIAFIEYMEMNYSEAIFKFNKIINEYPSHKNIDYAYFMKAMCYYEQIENSELDGINNDKALENFNQVIKRYPESKYARDSEQKIIFVKENMAAKHMNIALFYQKDKKYLAALNRYKIVIDKYSKSKFTPEALFRQVEIYYTLGMIPEAKNIASVISYNYPKSKWYKYSYNLLKKKDSVNNSNKNKSNIIKKISNFFNKNEKEK